ncbi:MAG: type VI secretion lipoprotein TssJ [Deltaproteobacteria bacterium]|nr:type VI secretion lipoprotein TssJ [Deltaproteobacteria bacterium]
MRLNLGYIFLFMLLTFLLSCGPKKNPALAPEAGPPVKSLDQLQYIFSPGAVKIGLIASPDLNSTLSTPAALSLCLYQLSDMAWFTANMSTAQGLAQLSDCQGSDKGLVGATRHLIQPGETKDLVIDRLGGTKYIAVAGGYSALPPQSGAAYLLIPVHENKKLIFANTYEIEELNAWLLLERQSLAFFPKTKEQIHQSASLYAKTNQNIALTQNSIQNQPKTITPAKGKGSNFSNLNLRVPNQTRTRIVTQPSSFPAAPDPLAPEPTALPTPAAPGDPNMAIKTSTAASSITAAQSSRAFAPCLSPNLIVNPNESDLSRKALNDCLNQGQKRKKRTPKRTNFKTSSKGETQNCDGSLGSSKDGCPSPAYPPTQPSRNKPAPAKSALVSPAPKEEAASK